MKIPVPASSQCLSTHMDGGDLLSPQIPEKLQAPLRELPNKIIFTCMSVSGTLPPVTNGGDSLKRCHTCRYHLWMHPQVPCAMP